MTGSAEHAEKRHNKTYIFVYKEIASLYGNSAFLNDSVLDWDFAMKIAKDTIFLFVTLDIV